MSPRCVISPQACWKKSPSDFGTPKNFGTWPIMIVSASPTMKPLSTGSEMNEAMKPSRSSPASRPSDPGDDGQRGGQRDVQRRIAAGERGDAGRGQRRGRRHRPDHQVSRTAQPPHTAPATGSPRTGRPPAVPRRSSRTPALPAPGPPRPSARQSHPPGPRRAGSPAARRTPASAFPGDALIAGRHDGRTGCRHPAVAAW